MTLAHDHARFQLHSCSELRLHRPMPDSRGRKHGVDNRNVARSQNSALEHRLQEKIDMAAKHMDARCQVTQPAAVRS
jgi:hypothetical protein